MAASFGWAMPIPGWWRRLPSPRGRAPATGLRFKRRMCHRRWHDLIRDGRRGTSSLARFRSVRLAMTTLALAARLVDGPHVPAPDKAEEILQGWLVDLEPVQSAEIGELLAQPKARAILRGIAEFSPYLFDLARADAARLTRLLRCEPETHLVSLIETTSRQVFAAAGEAEVMRLLRSMKSEAALLIALCDIGGVWPVMQVTAALTDLAVASVQMALRYLLRQEAARGRLLPPDSERPEENSGLFALAMGKMGAGELNYSSDIDLIVFFDPAAPTLSRDIEPQPFFVRVTQALSRLLQQRTGDGYVFRVDL